MADLKPCPFCGRTPTVDDCGDHRYFVRCKCGIAQDKLYAQKCDAVRRWNTRKTTLADVQPTQTNAESTQKWQKDFREYIEQLDLLRDDYRGIMEYINEVPAAQPQRVRGRWITQEFGSWAKCSECHELYDIPIANSNFCPNCGADMRGGEQDEQTD